MKKLNVFILLIFFFSSQSCKEKDVLTEIECNCSAIDFQYNNTKFTITDTLKIQTLKREFANLKPIEDDGRIIFGDTLFLKCFGGSIISIEINDDYIKIFDKKYKPQKSTSRIIRNYEGDAYAAKTIKLALENIDSTKTLILRDCNLRVIPKEIFKLENLEYLDLSINLIKNIPDDISKLHNLRDLSICYNLLDNVNPSISKLENLEKLWFLDNRIKVIPNELCDLKSLVEINITGNPIKNLPTCIPKMKLLENFYFGTFGDSIHNQNILNQIENFKRINKDLNIRI